MASGSTWCEALSPGTPKLQKTIRANLWSEVSNGRPFPVSGHVLEVAPENRVPSLSAGVPGKVLALHLATGTDGNSWDF